MILKNMYKKALAISSIAVALSMSVALPAYATDVPNFGSCVNPQWGQTQSNYNSNNGNGVIGVGSFSGTDTIYSSNGNLLQCLCTNSGQGYQTNWLNVSNLSQNDIDNLKARGWMYVPDGRAWGLSANAYMAQNSNYACTACTPTPTPAVSVTPTVTPTPGPTNTPTPGPNATATPETQVGAASANNLANTGNSFLIYISLLAGAASLMLGMILRKFSK
jgi:hypothetical protein